MPSHLPALRQAHHLRHNWLAAYVLPCLRTHAGGTNPARSRPCPSPQSPQAQNWFNAITGNQQTNQQQFLELGGDSSSGNLSAAQSLFSTMQQGSSSSGSTPTNRPDLASVPETLARPEIRQPVRRSTGSITTAAATGAPRTTFITQLHERTRVRAAIRQSSERTTNLLFAATTPAAIHAVRFKLVQSGLAHGVAHRARCTVQANAVSGHAESRGKTQGSKIKPARQRKNAGVKPAIRSSMLRVSTCSGTPKYLRGP